MSRFDYMDEVWIGGVLHAPVSEAHINAKAIEDAIVSYWAGDDWREHYPDALSYLRIIVTDDDDGDATIPEVVARILAAIEGGETP